AATIVVLAYRGLAFWMPMLLGFFMLQRLRSLGGKERALRELWNVRVVAILTALMGLVNVVSVTYPALARDLRSVTQFAPLQLRRGGQVGAMLTGLILFLLAGALWRRKRTAWLITVVVLLLSAVSLVLENSLFDIRSLLTLALAVWLVRQRAHFHARSDPPSVREGAVVIFGALAFLLLYGGVGIYVLALRSGEVHDLQTILTATLNTLVALRPPAWLPALEAGRFLLTSIYAAGVLTFLYAFFQLVRPVLLPRPATAAQRERASVLVTAYGRNATSRLALLPDVSYYFSSGGSVVAFLLVGRTAMALGDPIGPDGDAAEAIESFAGHCQRNDWLPAFYLATETYMAHYEAAGFDVMAVGREAIVDVGDFEQTGEHLESFAAAKSVMQLGHRAGVSMPPHSPTLLEELRLINDEWMTIVRGESNALLLSHFDQTQVAQSPIIMTQAPRSLVSAYATLIMDPGGESLAIDVLRHRSEVREGTLELLVIALIRWAQRHNFRYVNLGAGFPGLIGDGTTRGGSRDLLDENGEPPTVARLHAVRSRFNPRWAPRYLVYPGATSLPAVWNAVARQRWGGHWLWLLATRRLGL
ncbi:MAG: bifunctional lysylphosphatidylglycerol flippase/synthetase MprF, partial [Chloroflexota bacterium]